MTIPPKTIIDECSGQEVPNREYQWFMAGYRQGKPEGRQEVVEDCLKTISDEPEFPDEMPNELWEKMNGNKELTQTVMRNAVRLTKEGITDRLQAKLKE